MAAQRVIKEVRMAWDEQVMRMRAEQDALRALSERHREEIACLRVQHVEELLTVIERCTTCLDAALARLEEGG